MYKNKKILAVIPARAQNDKIDQLNLKTLGGKPLISYTIDAALRSGYIDNIYLSTENQELMNLANQLGVKTPFQRPDELTKLGITARDVTIDLLQSLNERYDYTIILWPNAPFRGSKVIDKAIENIVQNRYLGLQGVKKISDYFMLKSSKSYKPIKTVANSNRPDISEIYVIAGGLFIYDTDALLDKTISIEYKSFIMHEHDARLIYSLYDLLIAERLIKLHKSLVTSLIDTT